MRNVKLDDLSFEDLLDSRNLQERIDELEDIAEENEISQAEQEELLALLEVKNELEWAGWEHGISLIRDSYFEEYAEDLFDDCYAHNIPANLRSYIDYKAFARDLQMDYSIVEFNGVDFWFIQA